MRLDRRRDVSTFTTPNGAREDLGRVWKVPVAPATKLHGTHVQIAGFTRALIKGAVPESVPDFT